MLILTGIALVFLLTLATGYFVMQEFAYVAADRSKLRQLASNGDKNAERAISVTSRLSFVLSGAQLGITVTALLVGYVAEPFIGQGLINILDATSLPSSASTTISVVIALAFATVMQMVFGELGPKNLAIALPEAAAKSLSRSTLIYIKVAGPIIHVFDAAANKLLRSVGIEPVEELSGGATAADLGSIISESESRGLLNAETTRLLDHGLGFRELRVGQSMIPRVNVVTIHDHEPTTRVIELLETGHTRFPVIGADTDDLIGIIGITDLLQIPPAEREKTTVRSMASPALVIPETLHLPKALEIMRSEHRQVACVTNEHGSFSGIITIEDIAEELVGPIRDEDDPLEDQAKQNVDGSWTVPARLRLDEIEEATGISLPRSENYETVSGLTMDKLGRIPEVGDEMTIELEDSFDSIDDQPMQRFAHIKVTSITHQVAQTVQISTTNGEQ